MATTRKKYKKKSAKRRIKSDSMSIVIGFTVRISDKEKKRRLTRS